MFQDQKQTLEIIIFILLIVLGILLIALLIDRKNSKLSPKLDVAKYRDMINTLTIIEEILDRKIKLAKKGRIIEFGNYLTDQMIILELVSKGKLTIWGPLFTKDLMRMFELEEFDLIEFENASKYVKNELVKLRKLV